MNKKALLAGDQRLLELSVLHMTKKSFARGYEQISKKKDRENQFKAFELTILIKAIEERINTVCKDLRKEYRNDKDKLDIIEECMKAQGE